MSNGKAVSLAPIASVAPANATSLPEQSTLPEQSATVQPAESCKIDCDPDRLKGSAPPPQLVFRDVGFTVESNDECKRLLGPVSGSAGPGVLAIIGPSGAGKSTFLNVLTMEDMGGNPEGEFFLNGRCLDHEMFIQNAAFIGQEDLHWPYLSCEETINFAVRLNGVYDVTFTQQLLHKMGLQSCAKTRVGNAILKGLSGGQKRRLSIATSLTKAPTLLVLDEPTSGLDAASAYSVMSTIADLAHNGLSTITGCDEHTNGLIVITTIHQPAAKIYEGFDQVMLLSAGKVAYIGPSDDVLDYFKTIGHNEMPSNMNTAEYILELVNADFTSEQSVTDILDAWQKHDIQLPEIQQAAAVSDKKTATLSSYLTASFSRSFRLMVADPILYFSRVVFFTIATAFFAVVYLKARDKTQSQVLYRYFFSTWLVSVPTSMAFVTVHVSFEEAKMIKNEVRNGMISPSVYLAGKSVLEIPALILLSICALSVSAYGIADFHGPNYVEMVLVHAVILWSFECLAQLCAVSFSSSLLGMLAFLNTWFACFLFSGNFIQIDDIPWPLRAMSYVTPLRYALPAVAYIEFSETTFDKAQLCTPGSSGCASNDMETGWYCNSDVDPLTCYGYSGKQVLGSLAKSYSVVTAEDNVASYTLFIFLFGLFCKALYFVLLSHKVGNFVSPVPTSGAEREVEHSNEPNRSRRPSF